MFLTRTHTQKKIKQPSQRVLKGPFVVKWKGRDLPIGAHVAASLDGAKLTFESTVRESVTMLVGDRELKSDIDIVLELLAERLQQDKDVWYWSHFAKALTTKSGNEYFDDLNVLNSRLQLRTFLVGHKLSAADVALAAALNGSYYFCFLIIFSF